MNDIWVFVKSKEENICRLLCNTFWSKLNVFLDYRIPASPPSEAPLQNRSTSGCTLSKVPALLGEWKSNSFLEIVVTQSTFYVQQVKRSQRNHFESHGAPSQEEPGTFYFCCGKTLRRGCFVLTCRGRHELKQVQPTWKHALTYMTVRPVRPRLLLG